LLQTPEACWGFQLNMTTQAVKPSPRNTKQKEKELQNDTKLTTPSVFCLSSFSPGPPSVLVLVMSIYPVALVHHDSASPAISVQILTPSTGDTVAVQEYEYNIDLHRSCLDGGVSVSL
jgi:hypothetical protein